MAEGPLSQQREHACVPRNHLPQLNVSGGYIAGSEGVLRMPGGGNDENLEGDLGRDRRAEDHRVVHRVGYVGSGHGCKRDEVWRGIGDCNRRCVSTNARERPWAFKRRRVNCKPVLHRPVEPAVVFGKFSYHSSLALRFRADQGALEPHGRS
jgi:hypothetical protein